METQESSDERNLKSLLFCLVMARAARLKASSEALDEIIAVGGKLGEDWTIPDETPESRYVHRLAENAWNTKFEEVRSSIDCPHLYKIAASIPLGGEAFDNLQEGLITLREFVGFLIERLSFRVGPLGQSKPTVYQPVVTKSGVEL